MMVDDRFAQALKVSSADLTAISHVSFMPFSAAVFGLLGAGCKLLNQFLPGLLVGIFHDILVLDSLVQFILNLVA